MLPIQNFVFLELSAQIGCVVGKKCIVMQNWEFSGASFGGVKICGRTCQKARPCADPRYMSHCASKSTHSLRSCDLARKIIKKHTVLIGKLTMPLTMLPLPRSCDTCKFYDLTLSLIYCIEDTAVL